MVLAPLRAPRKTGRYPLYAGQLIQAFLDPNQHINHAVDEEAQELFWMHAVFFDTQAARTQAFNENEEEDSSVSR